MKKTLNIDNITNELEGASLFFSKQVSTPRAAESKEVNGTVSESSILESTRAETKQEKKKRNTEKTIPLSQPKLQNKAVINTNMQASNNASKHASNQALIHETMIETIRKAVKVVGKDSATYRFTPEEKKALLELSFSYKMQGYKTSENELTRISINFLLEDQKQNGQNSILQKVLSALSK